MLVLVSASLRAVMTEENVTDAVATGWDAIIASDSK